MRTPFLFALLVSAALAGCRTAQPWHGRTVVHGSLRGVMKEGRTEGRVELAPLAADPERVAVGALEGLRGEVALVRGELWISRLRADGSVETARSALPGERATLLVEARVPRWLVLELEQGIAPGELDRTLERLALGQQLVDADTFPFVIEGELAELEAHVVGGACPHAEGDGAPQAGAAGRVSAPRVRARLVGFFTRLEPGLLTHQGQRTHVHVIRAEGAAFVGHVDSVRVLPGARLELPAR